MLVVISDLHFQDVTNDCVALQDGSKFDPKVDRNVEKEAFELFAEDIKAAAKQNIYKELIILLAGDIFDLNRSQQWFLNGRNGNNVGINRPYHTDRQINGAPSLEWEATASKILGDIIADNQGAITALVNLVACCNKNGGNARIEYIPGNHDRIINLSSKLRQMVITALDIGVFDPSQGQMILRNNNIPFNNYFSSDAKTGIAHEDYGVLVRHGHEYDTFNFNGTADGEKGGISRDIPASEYSKPPFGDYITVELVMGLAYEARRLLETTVPTAPEMKTYKKIYRKLLEFDDVRPQTSIFDFIDFNFKGQDISDVLDKIIDGAMDKMFAIAEVNSFIAKMGLLAGIWSWFNKHDRGKSRAKDLLDKAKDETPAWKSAAKEEIISDKNSPIRYIVAGHTHKPSFDPLKAHLPVPLDESNENEDGYFFFDTGTWRKVIKKCNDDKSFASAKSLTYVIFYNKFEDPKKNGDGKIYSFDYWSGYTKKS